MGGSGSTVGQLNPDHRHAYPVLPLPNALQLCGTVEHLLDHRYEVLCPLSHGNEPVLTDSLTGAWHAPTENSQWGEEACLWRGMDKPC